MRREPTRDRWIWVPRWVGFAETGCQKSDQKICETASLKRICRGFELLTELLCRGEVGYCQTLTRPCPGAVSLGGMFPVTVKGERVTLREFTDADGDIDAVLAVYGDPAVTEHLSFEPRNRDQVAATITAVTTAACVEPRTEYSLAAAATGTGEVIGFARLAIDTQHPGQSSAQLGFALRADSWGQGLGEQTVMLLLRLGFDDLGLHRLWGARSPANDVSAHLMNKLGMVEEGRIRHHLCIRGAWRDSIVHSILDDEWQAAQAG